MEREAVSSSAIKSVGYDPQAKKLHVEFQGHNDVPGKVAEYDGVSADQHRRLMASESKGQFFHRHIRTKPEHHAWRYL